MNSFPEGFRALVIGASGGLGQAFMQALQANPRCAEVLGVHRHSKHRIDFADEASVADAAQALADLVASGYAPSPLAAIVAALHDAHKKVKR